MPFLFNFANWKTKTKISVAVLFAALLSIASLLVFILLISIKQAYEDHGEEMLNYGQLALSQADARITGDIQALQALALSPSLVMAVEDANKAYEGRSQSELDNEIAALDKAWKDGDPSIDNQVAAISSSTASGLLKQFAKTFPTEVEVFVTDIQGLNVGMTARTGDYLQADEGWWKSAYANGSGSTYISEVAFDDSTGIWAIDVGVPLRNQNSQVVGILRGTIDVSVVFQSFAAISFGQTGSAAILDQSGTVLFTKVADFKMKKAPENWVTLLAANNQGWQSNLSDLSGQPAVISYMRMTGGLGKSLGWTLVISQQTAELNRAIWSANMSVIWIALVLIPVMLALAFFISNYISHPISQAAIMIQRLADGDMQHYVDSGVQEGLAKRQDESGLLWRSIEALHAYMSDLSTQAQRIASGDLTVDVTARCNQDTLSLAFENMVSNLRAQVNQVSGSAARLEQETGQMNTAARQAGSASSQIVDVMHRVAAGVQEQSASIQHTSASVGQMMRAIDGLAKGATEQAKAVATASQVTNEMTTGIQQVAGNAQAVSKDSASAAKAARSGVSIVQQTVNGMDSIRARVGLSAQKVQDMGLRSKQIGLIVETIEDIASQTNLLALNAAIEAARAGEHGKGFAVVADEVRKLAERASSATKEISNLVKGIQTTVTEAVEAMAAGAREVENGVTLANQAGSALVEITSTAEAVLAQAEQAASASERMMISSRKLVEAMDSVSAVVEQNTAATEQMAASSTEVTQAVEHIAQVSRENTNSIQQVAASAQALSSQVNEVSGASSVMANLAQDLQVVVAQFHLEIDDSPVVENHRREFAFS